MVLVTSISTYAFTNVCVQAYVCDCDDKKVVVIMLWNVIKFDLCR